MEVKYGLIKILSLKEDLCEQLKNVDKECPIKEGETTLTRDVDLPQRIPPVRWIPSRKRMGINANTRAPIRSKPTYTPRTTAKLLA